MTKLLWMQLVFAVVVCTSSRAQEVNNVDVVVYGATPAGIAAALGAADAGVKNVVLLCEEYDIGGMMTLGGIGLRDHHTKQLLMNGTMYEWIELNTQYYKNVEKLSVKDFVFQPDNHVGLKNLWGVIKKRPAISVYVNTSLIEGSDNITIETSKVGRKISSIKTKTTGKTASITTWKASVFIDATYAGDLMNASGVTWTYGREPRDQYNESLAGVTNSSAGNFEVDVNATWPNGTLLKWVDPASELKAVGEGDHRVMGYSYRLCITQNKENMAPFPEPESYNPDDWELLRRYYKAMVAANKTVYLPFHAFNYFGYPTGEKRDMCDAGPNTAISTDAANLAHGYPNGNRTARQKIATAHKEYLKGLIHFILTDDSVPEYVYKNVSAYGLCKDEWPENDHWPPVMYVREAGRLVGDLVYTQNDRIQTNKLRRVDSVAVADWGIDIHIMARTVSMTSDRVPIARNEGQTKQNEGVYRSILFDLPYSVLLPKKKELTNLLVPNCPSVTHVVFAAIQEEPTLWQLGRASGVAAALYIQQDGAVSLQDLDVNDIQTELTNQGAVYHWPGTSDVPPPRWGGNNDTLVWQASINVTDMAGSPDHPYWTFNYYYDWTRKASRYDHLQGQHDFICKGMKGQEDDGRPCTLLNAVDGSLYVMYPVQKYCCSCGSAFTIRSDWLQNGGTTYEGQSTINKQEVYEWLKYGNNDNHYYATTDSKRQPVRYYEHSVGKIRQWDFYNWKPMASQNLTSLLAVPKNCTVKCMSSFCSSQRDASYTLL